MSFESMGLSPEILQAVKELGYVTPSPIQLKSIPHAMAGKDLMACAQTGTGKTAAFALPILHRLSQVPKAPLRALVLVPTRELAIQVGKNIREYSKYTSLEVTTVFGGVPFDSQTMMLRHGVDILVATPGRLIDHMWRGNIDYRNTEYLVLDEADRMLDMGFIDAVREIVREIPTKRQTLLFSATLGGEIQRLSRGILIDPVKVEVAPSATTVETVDQRVIFVEQDDKQRVLEGLIQEHEMDRAIIFTRTKVGATKLASKLRQRGYRAAPIHSDRSQNERVATLEAFRAGKVNLLVATDIAARGIDVDHVGHVVNYDVPFSAEDYVHRIGRTARAGRTGMAIMLATSRDRATLHAIERLVGTSLTGNERNGSSKIVSPVAAETRNNGGSASGSRSRRRRGSRSGSRPAATAPVLVEASSTASVRGARPDRRSDSRRDPRAASDSRQASHAASDSRRAPHAASDSRRAPQTASDSRRDPRAASGPRDERMTSSTRNQRKAADPREQRTTNHASRDGAGHRGSNQRRAAGETQSSAIAASTPRNPGKDPSAAAPGIFQSVLGRIFRRQRPAPSSEAARV